MVTGLHSFLASDGHILMAPCVASGNNLAVLGRLDSAGLTGPAHRSMISSNGQKYTEAAPLHRQPTRAAARWGSHVHFHYMGQLRKEEVHRFRAKPPENEGLCLTPEAHAVFH